jgi:hypothetical protein
LPGGLDKGNPDFSGKPKHKIADRKMKVAGRDAVLHFPAFK